MFYTGSNQATCILCKNWNQSEETYNWEVGETFLGLVLATKNISTNFVDSQDDNWDRLWLQ